MLKAYIDDSGWDGRSSVFVLAGYLARLDDWQKFQDAWETACKLEPVLEHLKMRDAFRHRKRDSVFYGWTERQRDERLNLFADIINQHALYGIISVIPIKPYRAAFDGRFKLEALDRPYLLSFTGIIAQLYSFAHRHGLNDRVDFIFDTLGGESKAFVMDQYKQFIALAPPHLKDVIGSAPDFQRDDEVPALQAADMIAWHARRYHYELKPNARPEDFESPLFARLLNTEHILDVWSEDRIISAANATGPDLRQRSESSATLTVTFTYDGKDL